MSEGPTERAGPRVLDSVEVTLKVEITDDELVPYRARVNDGCLFADSTGLEAIRRALHHTDDFSIPDRDEYPGNYSTETDEMGGDR